MSMHIMPTFHCNIETLGFYFNKLATESANLRVIGRMVMQMAHLDADTCFAGPAVEEVISATCFAYSTLTAVKLLLGRIVIEKTTHQAVELTKRNSAALVLTEHRWCLNSQATVALDLSYSLLVELVRDLSAPMLTQLRLNVFLIFREVETKCALSPAVSYLELGREYVLLVVLQIVTESTREE